MTFSISIWLVSLSSFVIKDGGCFDCATAFIKTVDSVKVDTTGVDVNVVNAIVGAVHAVEFVSILAPCCSITSFAKSQTMYCIQVFLFSGEVAIDSSSVASISQYPKLHLPPRIL